ncbi:leucine-rich_repeat domain-containing protein [Hexamita inflata]|uniref:Leucine-rich repeat domain-containing protein n=1 Tax=Hexamita inflata TaxID=28002 RepID=A0AA86PC10_9EUKA|nr:leucine-rich repeat domain-containing protein [Hexamita inflata]
MKHKLQFAATQKIIDIGFIKRNIKNIISEEDANQKLMNIIGNQQAYKLVYQNNYDAYYTHFYFEQIDYVALRNPYYLLGMRYNQESFDLYIVQKVLHDIFFVQSILWCRKLSVRFSYNLNFNRVPNTLTSLLCMNCKLSSIDGIQHMTALERLTLSCNELVDVFQVRFLIKLQYLDLQSNQIIFLDPLKELQISTLIANNNFLPIEQILINNQINSEQNPQSESQQTCYKKLKTIQTNWDRFNVMRRTNLLRSRVRRFGTQMFRKFNLIQNLQISISQKLVAFVSVQEVTQ